MRTTWIFFAMASALIATGCRRTFHRTETIRYQPEKCATARGFVDFAGVLKLKTLKTVDNLPSQLAHSAPFYATFVDQVKKIGNALDSEKISFGTELREASICVGSGKSTYVVVGGELGGDQALKRFERALTQFAQSIGRTENYSEKKNGGIVYATSAPGSPWVAMPAPNVIVFSQDDESAIANLTTTRAVQASDWHVDADTLVAIYGDARSNHVKFSISLRGSELTLDAKIGSLLVTRWNPVEMDNIRRTIARDLANNYPDVANPVSNMTFAIKNGELDVRITVDDAKFADALTKLFSDSNTINTLSSHIQQQLE
jgi:hypothetical protein